MTHYSTKLARKIAIADMKKNGIKANILNEERNIRELVHIIQTVSL
jgi:hypothetical protein